MTTTRITLIALIGCALMGGGVAMGARHLRASRVATLPAELRAPDSVRVRVQVLNGTRTRGLARRATLLLRNRGFDVVESGTVNGAHDSTLVIDLSGHPEWARRVASIMSPAVIVSRPDSSRYLDVSVVLGSRWRAPAEPFYP